MEPLAAKQEAFEESIRLKNQFRTLDDDEIEFLDSVLESTRAREEAVKKETTEQLDAFRRQQEEADKALFSGEAGADDEIGAAGSPVQEDSQWTVNARKRKRAKEKEILKGVKLRKGSSSAVEKLGTAIGKDSDQSVASATSPTAEKKKSTEDKHQEALTNAQLPQAGTKPADDNTTKALTTSPKAASPLALKAMAPVPPPYKSGPALGLALAGYSSEEDD